LKERRRPATGAFAAEGVGVGGVNQGLAALVAMGQAAVHGIPVDAALGVAGAGSSMSTAPAVAMSLINLGGWLAELLTQAKPAAITLYLPCPSGFAR
jgi:hypothetical protein